jgi:hypothetical protein
VKPKNGSGPRGRATAEDTTSNYASVSVTPSGETEVARVRRARAQHAARCAQAAAVRDTYVAKTAGLNARDRARLSAQASELVLRALEGHHASAKDVSARAPAPTGLGDSLPLQPVDAPHYRATRPPGVGIKIEVGEPVSP